MEILCTRPSCPRPQNFFSDLDDNSVLKTVQQKYCISCGMQLILVGRYLPYSLLGRGGFGAAFLARDRYTPTTRRCVVKQFLPAGDLSPQQLQIAQNLFEREGEVLEALGTHAQIPDLYAFFELTAPSLQADSQEKFFYLVQEFIDGKTLEQELADNGKFSQAQILEVLRAILPVLKFVHDSGSIHRDIKPSNIMRHRNGTIYLLDFGAVKQIANVSPGGSSTGIYSMGFAPPEQMSGGQVYPSTDLYALAVTCLELLTGKPPNELFDAYNNQWEWRSYAQVSDRLADVLDKMLQPVPKHRFQSVDEVIAALSHKPAPPVPQPPTPPPPIPQPPVSPASPPTPQASLFEIFLAAGLSGFIGVLLFNILKFYLQLQLGIIAGIVGAFMGGLIFAQYRRIIASKGLFFIAAILLLISLFFVRESMPIILYAGLGAMGAIAITAIFRLVYQLLSWLL